MSARSIINQIEAEARLDVMSPQEAFDFYSEIAEHCETAADALREENEDVE